MRKKMVSLMAFPVGSEAVHLLSQIADEASIWDAAILLSCSEELYNQTCGSSVTILRVVRPRRTRRAQPSARGKQS